ncbi:hypothetical protein PO860_18040 [Rhizobium sp. BJ04]|uniref:hypothetical protein n=1 Tax=Rhizobium binxianense TaxID=3024242 RepID=UPI0023AA0F17|nr:hypothetical protein [Rhizobium sp. BJ04]WEA59537.1 hypothetical protein PO860_18040 [Rhizobium sp. BJ04]
MAKAADQLDTEPLPHERVEAFVSLARKFSDVLIHSDKWDEKVWACEGFVVKGQNRTTFNLYFHEFFAKLRLGKVVAGEPLDETFAQFAKAYVRYLHSTAPVTWDSTKVRLEALRVIEHSFRALGFTPRIENLSVGVLNHTIDAVRSIGGASRQYSLAVCIQQVYQFCRERMFLNGPFEWRQPIQRPEPRAQRLDKGAKTWRENRLPSVSSFQALGHIFRHAITVPDRLMSSVCAIMISVPIRVHEVLQLRLDCEVYGTTKSKRDEDIETYGLRVWPGKGNPPQVKWVPTAMVSIVQEAIRTLVDMGRAGREMALWYEQHPTKIFLPAEVAHLRELEWIHRMDLAKILGINSRDSVDNWVKKRPLIRRKSSTADSRLDLVNFADIEREILGLLPRGFPYFNGYDDQLFSNSLILVKYNEFHATRATYQCMIETCTVSLMQLWLNGGEGKANVFDRWGFEEPDGNRMQVNTHAFRHWLNTIAQLKGLSDLDIAKWSGRDPSQNEAYNHVTSEEILTQIRDAVDGGNVVGPLFEGEIQREVRSPVTKQEFLQTQIGSALLTDAGFCVHDYSLLPCQNYADCLGCSENVFIKGDTSHRDKIEKRLSIAESQQLEAEAAVNESFRGADRWLTLHARSIDLMRRMLAVHGDPMIVDGTVVNMDVGRQDNPIAMAFRDREATGTSFPGSKIRSLKTFNSDDLDIWEN